MAVERDDYILPDGTDLWKGMRLSISMYTLPINVYRNALVYGEFHKCEELITQVRVTVLVQVVLPMTKAFADLQQLERLVNNHIPCSH